MAFEFRTSLDLIDRGNISEECHFVEPRGSVASKLACQSNHFLTHQIQERSLHSTFISTT